MVSSWAVGGVVGLKVGSLSSDDRTPDSGSFSYATRPPFLITEAAATVKYAQRTLRPVWLKGGPGTGAYEVARALHRDGAPLSFVSLRVPLADARDLEARLRNAIEDDLATDVLTLYAERVERLAPALQERLLRYSDEGAHWQGRAVPVRLMAQSDGDVRESEILPALRSRMSPLVVHLPPLALRAGELREIALSIAERLAVDLGMPGVRIGEAALRELAQRQWPRNLDELSAAVARTLFSPAEPEGREHEAPKGVSRHLVRSLPSQRAVSVGEPSVSPAPGSVPAAGSGATDPASPSPSSPSGEAMMSREIERIVAELAHELKNPMVTIKTFGENLDTIFENPSLREKFTDLAREAIDRMDGFLEDLLQFSRFREPRTQPMSLSQVLGTAIRSNTAQVRNRVTMNASAEMYRIRADADQLSFALRSVLRGLGRATAEETPIHIDVSPPDGLVFRSRLAAVMPDDACDDAQADTEAEASTPNSLDFILADALVRRHEGVTRILRKQGQLQIRVSLPGLEPRDDG